MAEEIDEESLKELERVGNVLKYSRWVLRKSLGLSPLAFRERLLERMQAFQQQVNQGQAQPIRPRELFQVGARTPILDRIERLQEMFSKQEKQEKELSEEEKRKLEEMKKREEEERKKAEEEERKKRIQESFSVSW